MAGASNPRRSTKGIHFVIFKEKDSRSQRVCIVVSRQWPDKKRFRRRVPNMTVAKNLMARIDGAIAIGTWSELRRELSNKPKPTPVATTTPVAKVLTVAEFSKIYIEEYCKKRNTRPDFKVETFKAINRIVGSVLLRDFTREDAYRFESVRGTEVAASTVNRGLAVLSHMFTHAVKTGRLKSHPMQLYGRLKVKPKARRYLTIEEERRLVSAVSTYDATVGLFVGVLGETGLRYEEGLRAKWDEVDIQRRILTVAASKTGEIRHVPLSDFAIQCFRKLPRVVGISDVFVRLSTKRAMKAPRRPFVRGKAAAGLSWVKGFRDLRHFRASQWVRNGIDLVTVQSMMGHEDIETTMIYAHFDSAQGFGKVIDAQRLEVAAGNK